MPVYEYILSLDFQASCIQNIEYQSTWPCPNLGNHNLGNGYYIVCNIKITVFFEACVIPFKVPFNVLLKKEAQINR